MGKKSSTKGARGEREAKALLQGLFPWMADQIDRKLGAGRKDDTGDMLLPGWTVQVAYTETLGKTLLHKARDCEAQQANAGTPYGVTLMKLPPRPGGKPAEWRFVMTPEQFATVLVDLRSQG